MDDATKLKRISFLKEKKKVADALIVEIQEIQRETNSYLD